MVKVFNTGETQEDLRLKYNPEGSVLRKVQMRILEMLKYVDSVCTELNIKWSLEGGNVLGAIRHGGFIPWDDDADIIMEREDYLRFVEYVQSHPHSQFAIQNHHTDPHYYMVYSVIRDLKSEYIQDTPMHLCRKYRGMQLDIFPIERGAFKPIHWFLGRVSIFSNQYCAGRVNWLAECIYQVNNLLCVVARNVSQIFGDKSKFMYCYGYWSEPIFCYNDTFPTKPITFEGVVFPGPCHIDSYLKSLYKNYMDLPSSSNRDRHEVIDYKVWD